MMFVDGSNLFGVGKHLSVEFNDYEGLYRYLFKQCVDAWRFSFLPANAPTAQLLRVYWYVVGAIDEWDLTNPKAQAHLRRLFEDEKEIYSAWMKTAAEELKRGGKQMDQAKLAEHAWGLCFGDFKNWYEEKKKTLDGMKRFHYAVEAATDFIEIRRVGRWKVDFLHKAVQEKGLDTSFAVDMVSMLPSYEVAILISGDADGIPSVAHVKNSGRHVGAVEFLKGFPPEDRAKNVSANLKIAADFVAPIYEMDLIKEGIAKKPAVVAAHP